MKTMVVILICLVILSGCGDDGIEPKYQHKVISGVDCIVAKNYENEVIGLSCNWPNEGIPSSKPHG